ncbi:uncharacterized protein LOC115823735 [Chanos chanos]|uniref:Uncharacterized protein LOC115823735 n=1 Tax=Chanos chanos TaxID=29144 RepID=A0A6J2WH30_CHACN|nr:uncharacterized protein LOC115823735 [Chanos chanos]
MSLTLQLIPPDLSSVYHNSSMKQQSDYETQTGRSVLPALQPVYQSAPAVWNIDLSERKASLFLEVLKLQTEKKPVELRDCLSSSFLMSIIREIYETRSAHCVSSLLSSVENYINLSTRVLDTVDCAALCFTLQHSKGVRLNLLWTSIPEEAIENILPFLNTISHLSVDRRLLLRLLHCCCMDSELQQGAAAALLRALQHTLDFSCCSAVDLSTESEGETLHLSPEHCRLISMAIQSSDSNTHLILQDCDIQDAGLNELFPILHKIRLSCSKNLLLQFLTLVCVGTESGSVKCAVALSQALGDEVDFSETRLDLQACRSLALVLEHSDGLSELDLSHCQLTDHCLELLLPHLHKTQVLE